MSDISRRDALRRLGLVLMATGFVDRVAAQEVHQMAGAGAGCRRRHVHAQGALRARLQDARAPHRPDHSGRERRAGRSRSRRRGLDRHDGQRERPAEGHLHEGPRPGSTRRWFSAGQKDFVSAPPARQTALLDLIAYRRNQTPELAPGIEFFTWARRMTVDAFYTSEIGIKDIDYRGNTPHDDVSRTDRGDRVRVEKERARIRSCQLTAASCSGSFKAQKRTHAELVVGLVSDLSHSREFVAALRRRTVGIRADRSPRPNEPAPACSSPSTAR